MSIAVQVKTLFVKSRLISLRSDLDEMKQRMLQVFSGLLTSCAEKYGPLVSIIIPTRNERARITALIKSLKASCYKNMEIIVADYIVYGWYARNC